MLHLQLNTNKQDSFVFQRVSVHVIAGRCELWVSVPKLLAISRAPLKPCCSTSLCSSGTGGQKLLCPNGDGQQRQEFCLEGPLL